MEEFDNILTLMADFKGLGPLDDVRSSKKRELLAALTVFLNDGMSNAWLGIFGGESPTLMQSESYRLITGHRILSNFLATHALEATDVAALCARSEYIQSVVLALLRVLSSTSNYSRIVSHFRELFSGLPLDAHVALLEALVSCAQSSSRGSEATIDGETSKLDFSLIIDAIPSDWYLDGSMLLLRLARRAHPSQPSKDILPLLGELVKRAIQYGATSVDVVDMLLLRKTMDEAIAATIMKLLPLQGLHEALETIASVWGCRLFISRGDLKMQQCLSKAILCGLDRIANDSLSNDIVGGINFLFSAGISAYLDLSCTASRLCGMRVAIKVAQLSGQVLVFDEVVEADRLATATPTATATTTTSTVAEMLAPQPGEDYDESDKHVNVSDTDSELDAFDLGEEDAPTSACYLRTCLDLLRHPDNNSNAHDKHLQALVSIPTIVSSNPLDASDLSSELMKELIRMGNTFNLARFDSLRREAMLSLLVNYPELTIPVCAGAVQGEIMLGCKLLCIHVLILAAHRLSGVPLERNDSIEGVAKNQIDETAPERLGITRIKRPRMLAKLGNKTTLFRNSFGSVALLAFQPIASALNSLTPRSILCADEGESIESLLPSQLLLALASFTTCAINTPVQRLLIDQTVAIATPLTIAPALSVRRAALSACLASIQAFNLYRIEVRGTRNDARFNYKSPMAILSNLARSDLLEDDGVSFAPFVTLLNLSSSHLEAEADRECRGLLNALIRSAAFLLQ